MRLRSLLFVPGDRPDRIERARSSGADALILDLEDSVIPARKNLARQLVADALNRPRSIQIFVRINSLASGMADDDLSAVMSWAPDEIVLPKAEGRRSVVELDRRMTILDNGRTKILPIATETPAAIFGLGGYGGLTPRLCAVTWGAEDLPVALGATSARENNGNYTSVFEVVRALALLGAHAAGVPAIETVYPRFKDGKGLAAYVARGRRDGFSGMLAIHPDQVSVINKEFAPTNREVVWAKRVVALFNENPGAGALQMEGTMLDAPHLSLARRLLEQIGDAVSGCHESGGV